MKTRLIILLITIFTASPVLFAQNNRKKARTPNVSCPEKWWVVCHFLIAKKAFIITKESLHITDSIAKTQKLGSDINGGKMDAFKHAYWMAALSQQIKGKKAYRLGKAHEKGNYKTYKKGIKKGKDNLPDKASSEMDLWNNDIGINIGKQNKYVTKQELQQLVLDAVLSGQLRILNKDETGNFLDCQNQIIPRENLSGKWKNEKCLIPSDK